MGEGREHDEGVGDEVDKVDEVDVVEVYDMEEELGERRDQPYDDK